jgi:S-adenosylmethionine hydrolase
VTAPTGSGIVTLLTDFGTRDVYAGVMRGVILGIAPGARIVDLTHEVPPQDVFAGAMLLRSAVDYFPDGTVHLAVVDPGVGSAREPVAVITERAVLVGPDNGLLHPAAEKLGLREVRRLDRSEIFRSPVSQTFHGRDVFAPVAAHLGAGLDPASVGSPWPGLAPLPVPPVRRASDGLHGEVVHVDGYGNLITNVTAGEILGFSPTRVSVRIAGVTISSLSTAYAAVPSGTLLAIIGSWGTLEIAERDGNAARRLGASRRMPVVVSLA